MRPGTASIFTPKAGTVQRVDHVGARCEHAHDFAHRHHNMVVGAKKARLARGLGLVVGQHQCVECEIAVVGIFVGPVPLLADGFDGEIGGRRSCLRNRAAGTTGWR